ncbi:MAG: hypothetical protein ACYDC6_06835 [Acidobacteriaceae bacterium]
MTARTATRDDSFPYHWQVEVLERPPLIAPSRQYVYPQAVEEIERGALLALLRARPGAAPVLATFGLGFADPSLPHGIWSCPNPAQLCAIAGGYAYIVEVDHPERWLQIPYRPVISVHAAAAHALLIFSSFHTLWALGVQGQAWETRRLSWEGVRVTEILGGELHGFGWDLHTDAEVPFTVDLATGNHTGGAKF